MNDICQNQYTYKIYPPLGIARVGNGPTRRETSIFTPEVPWQHFYDTTVEYLVTESDLEIFLNSYSINEMLYATNLLEVEVNELTEIVIETDLSDLLDPEEISYFVNKLKFTGDKENCIRLFKEEGLKTLKISYLGAIKKQAQRFYIYKFDQDGNPCGKLPASEIENLEWHVDVGNKKAFWYDYNNALDLSLDESNGNLNYTVAQEKLAPALTARRRNPNVIGNQYRKQMVIRSQGSVSSTSNGPVRLTGQFPAMSDGEVERLIDLLSIKSSHEVNQGTIEYDHDNGALIFYAGNGISQALISSSLNTDFADNSNWYDDICDGRITATLTIKGSKDVIELKHADDSAWIATAPPDFAPQIEPLVTMYDMITGANYTDNDLINLTTQFSDVFPILYRLYRMQWVNQADFADNSLNVKLSEIDFKKLLSVNDKDKSLRQDIFKRFRNPFYPTSPYDPISGKEIDQIRIDANKEHISNARLIPSMDTTSTIPTPTPAELKLPYYPGDGVDYPGSPMQWFTIPPFMYQHLQNWAEGRFAISDEELCNAETIESLAKYYIKQFEGSKHGALLNARAAMDSLYGGGFHPGVELTWPMRRKQMYCVNKFITGVNDKINLLGLREFRINAADETEQEEIMYKDFGRLISVHDVSKSTGSGCASWLWKSTPGDLTKWMGIPWQSDAASCQAVYTAQDFPIPAWWAANLPVTVIPSARYDKFKQGFKLDDTNKDGIRMDPERYAAMRQSQFALRQPWLQTANTGFVGYHAEGGYTLGLVSMVNQWANMGMVMARPGTVDGSNVSAEIPEVVYVSYGANSRTENKMKFVLPVIIDKIKKEQT